MFEVGALYNSTTGQVFRCTAWDWKDRSWWFHPANDESSFWNGCGLWVSENGRELDKPSSPVLILKKKEEGMALNLKQQKFIQENQDLFNEILEKIPHKETISQADEKDLTGLEWNSLEDLIEKLKTILPSDARSIGFFADDVSSDYDDDIVGISWTYTKEVQYTESEREKMAFIKLQQVIIEKNIKKENEKRRRK